MQKARLHAAASAAPAVPNATAAPGRADPLLNAMDVAAGDVAASARGDTKWVPKVKLMTSKTATVRHGAELPRSSDKQVNLCDCYGFIPYSLELSPSSSAADAVQNAAALLGQFGDVLEGQPWADAAPTPLLQQISATSDAGDAAASRAAHADAATLAAGRTGYGPLEEQTRKAVAKLVLHTAEAAQGMAQGSRPPAQAGDVTQAEVQAAAIKSFKQAVALPTECSKPPLPDPDSIPSALRIDRLLRWRQTVKIAAGVKELKAFLRVETSPSAK